MKAVIYCRISPRRKLAESESIRTQEEICRAYAEGLNIEVGAVFADVGKSGDDLERPELWLAIDALRKGDCIIVWKRDRLCRSVYLNEVITNTVTATGATIRAVSGDVEGDSDEVLMIRQILASVHEYEKKVIAARTKVAMRHHQANGRRMSAIPPYGYKVDPDDEKRIVKVDFEQKMILLILDLHKNGVGKYAIATKMNKNPSYKMMARHGIWKGKLIGNIIKREG